MENYKRSSTRHTDYKTRPRERPATARRTTDARSFRDQHPAARREAPEGTDATTSRTTSG
eukprot:5424840-Pyramimonas_sp.AAC.1